MQLMDSMESAEDFRKYTEYITKKMEDNEELEIKLNESLTFLEELYEKPVKLEILFDNEFDSENILEIFNLSKNDSPVDKLKFIDLGDTISLEIPRFSIWNSTNITLTALNTPPNNPIQKNIFPGTR